MVFSKRTNYRIITTLKPRFYEDNYLPLPPKWNTDCGMETCKELVEQTRLNQTSANRSSPKIPYNFHVSLSFLSESHRMYNNYYVFTKRNPLIIYFKPCKSIMCLQWILWNRNLLMPSKPQITFLHLLDIWQYV